MKHLIFLMTILLCSCSKKASHPDHLPDDYVLIEFAASLEDEYDKLYPPPAKAVSPPSPSKTK